MGDVEELIKSEIAACELGNAELSGESDNLAVNGAQLCCIAQVPLAGASTVARNQGLPSCANQLPAASLTTSHLHRSDSIERPTEAAKGSSWRSGDPRAPEQNMPLWTDGQPVCPTRKPQFTDCQPLLMTKLQTATEIGIRLDNQVVCLTRQMDALKHDIDTIAAELHRQKVMQLGRLAANKVHVELAQQLWKCGTQPPFRLANLHQMLVFLRDMRAARSPRGSCGSMAHKEFLSRTEEEKIALYDKVDALIEQARRCDIPNLLDATISLDRVGELAISVVHPMKGKFAACAAQVEPHFALRSKLPGRGTTVMTMIVWCIT